MHAFIGSRTRYSRCLSSRNDRDICDRHLRKLAIHLFNSIDLHPQNVNMNKINSCLKNSVQTVIGLSLTKTKTIKIFSLLININWNIKTIPITLFL